MAQFFDNPTATTNPTVTDDNYFVGARWLNTTTGVEHRCLSNSAGSAVWRKVGIQDSAGALPGQRAGFVIVRSLSDLPTPVSNVISLANNTIYEINGTVDIGANRIVCGIKNTLRGVDRTSDGLTSSTTGALISSDSSSVAKIALTCSDLTLECSSGKVFDLTSTSNNHSILIVDCGISGDILGTIHNIKEFILRNVVVSGCTTEGFTFTGTGSGDRLHVRDSTIYGITNVFLDLGSATFDALSINRNNITITTGNVGVAGLSDGSNIIDGGIVASNVFLGGGTYTSGIGVGWVITNNIGIMNNGSATVVVDFGSGETDSVTVTVAATWVTTGSRIVCSPLGDGHADHTADETALEKIQAFASNIVPGVGFDVTAWSGSDSGTSSGSYLIHCIAV